MLKEYVIGVRQAVRNNGHYTKTLLDCEEQDIEIALVNACWDLGVPARCAQYDIVSAVRQELGYRD